MKNLMLFSPLFLLVTACGSTPVFKVTSEPEKAEVLIVTEGEEEPKKIGETPFEKVEEDLKKEVGTLKTDSGFVEVIVKKEGFASKKLWLPLSPSGSLRSTLKVTLKEDKVGTSNLDTVEKILDQVFLAQKFARLKQFERALIEIDKVLNEHPKFTRALSLKGSIYYANGDFKNSLEWYEKAITEDPEFTHAIEMSSKVRTKLKLPPRAPASKAKAAP